MSQVYKHYTKDKINQKAQCKLCNKFVPWKGSSTKDLWTHLKNHHSSEYKELKKNDEQPNEINPVPMGTAKAQELLLIKSSLDDIESEQDEVENNKFELF